MNNYITLDNKKYHTPATQWKPDIQKPATVRVTILGSVDATYGPASIPGWEGEIEAAVTPETGFGSISDLRATLSKCEEVVFSDHYGANYYVHVLGPFQQDSKSPMWDGASNKLSMRVKLMRSRDCAA